MLPEYFQRGLAAGVLESANVGKQRPALENISCRLQTHIFIKKKLINTQSLQEKKNSSQSISGK